MNKKIILPISLMLLVGLAIFVSASSKIISYPDSEGGTNGAYYDYEYDIVLHKGWNLIANSENFPFSAYQQASDLGLSELPLINKKLRSSYENYDYSIAGVYVYGYNKQQNNYEIIFPTEQAYNVPDRESAVWVYSEEEGRLVWFAPNVKPLKDIYLTTGWNFLGVNPEMAGKSINQIKGNCNLLGVYAYEDSKWVSLMTNLNDERMLGENSAQGHGIIIKVSEDCKLASGGSSTNPPTLPN